MARALSILILLSLSIAGCGSTPPSTPEAVADTPTQTLVPTATSFPTPTFIPTAIPDVLHVDPSTALGPISPLVHGSNLGPWLVVSLDMLHAAYDSGITILRFPGGAWGDHNDLKGYQIDSFMDFANKVGATVFFSVRLLDGSPAQAAEFVRYLNLERKYNIQYWNIGNELIYSSSDNPDLSIYAARREDGTLTIMVINLSLEEKTKALRIGDQTQVQAEAWLFDPAHKAENFGSLELSNELTFPHQSVTLYIIP